MPGLVDRAPAPLDKVLAGEEARQVQRLLGELRYDRDRQVLFRFYLSDHSKEEICADLEIEPLRFHKVLFHARELWPDYMSCVLVVRQDMIDHRAADR